MKLSELEDGIYYWVKIANRFAVLENLIYSEDINGGLLYCNCFSTLLWLVPLRGFT